MSKRSRSVSLTMRALEIYLVRVTARRKSARKAHMHHLPFVTHIQFRDIKLCWMTLTPKLGLARCADVRTYVHAAACTDRARGGIREIGQESVRTVWPCFRLCRIAVEKKRLDADRTKRTWSDRREAS